MTTNKKKILIRIGSLRHGGAEKVLVSFLKNIPNEKYDVDLLLNLYSGKYLPDVPSWVRILYLNKGEMITTNRPQDLPRKIYRVLYQKLLRKFPKLLYRFILKNKPYDIEFAAIHGLKDDILQSPIKSSKKIVWIHNDLEKTPGYNNEKIKSFFGFDAILVISEHIKTSFEKLAQTPEEKQKIKRIYNPLDTNEILEKAELGQIKYQFSKKVPTFISIGTVFPQKGFDRILKAHKKLLDKSLDHRILIIGDGYEWNKTKQLIQDLGIENTATMLGFCDNPYPYLKEADFYLLGSRYEGFPTVLFEAITLKKNIIATKVSGAEEILEKGKLGLLIDNNQQAIENAMQAAISEREKFLPYQKQLKNYQNPFALQSSVAKICSILDEL